jgi:hypothetical protein
MGNRNSPLLLPFTFYVVMGKRVLKFTPPLGIGIKLLSFLMWLRF